MRVVRKSGRRAGARDDIDRMFRLVERLTSVGAATSALEQLSVAHTLDDRGLLGWPVNRTRLLGLNRGAGKQLDKVLGYPRYLGVLRLRMLAGMGLVAPVRARRKRAALLAGMVGTGIAQNLRSNYGLDGSDHFAFINYTSAMVEKLFPDDDRAAREFVLSFIAAQSCLSYFTSGVVKLGSPMWRSGTAIDGIFRTRTYGDRFFYRLFRDYPPLAKLLAWSVIVAETAFPLVLIAPKPLARAILLAGMGFHVGNARFMGLNRFFWSFVASYPAVAYFSRALGRTDRDR